MVCNNCSLVEMLFRISVIRKEFLDVYNMYHKVSYNSGNSNTDQLARNLMIHMIRANTSCMRSASS